MESKSPFLSQTTSSPSSDGNKTPEEEKYLTQCFTCKSPRFLKSFPTDMTIPEYEDLVEKGYWRVGKYMYEACVDCHERHTRIKTEPFIKKYFKDGNNIRFNKLKKGAAYKDLYKSLEIKFVPADKPNQDIENLYEGYQISNGDLVDHDAFYKEFCISAIGSINEESIEKFNKGNFKIVPTGSMFAVWSSQGQPVIAIMFDVCEKWVGFKRFWFVDPTPLKSKPVMTRICLLKCFEVANLLGKEYGYLSYFSHKNDRLLYKLNYNEFLDIKAGKEWKSFEKVARLQKNQHQNYEIVDVENYLKNITVD